MNNKMYPIVDLVSKAKPIYDNQNLHHLLEKLGFVIDDEFTFTFRVYVPEERISLVRTALLAHGEDGQALVEKLEELDWDASFLYDIY